MLKMNCENCVLNAQGNNTADPFLLLLLPHFHVRHCLDISQASSKSPSDNEVISLNPRSVWSHGHSSASPAPFISCCLSKEQWKGAWEWGVDEYELLKGARKKALQKQEDLSFKLQVRELNWEKWMWKCSECCLCCLIGSRGCCF